MKRKSSILLFLLVLLCNCQETKSQYSNENRKAIQANTELEPPISYSDYVQSYITIDTSQIALVNVKIIDGTGNPALANQTILIQDNQIVGLGHQDELRIPDGFLVVDGFGKTVIPGIVGTHNHLRLPQGAMLYTGPRLYLASGVTTIQTCGTGHPAEEIAIARAIKAGNLPGPEIINSGPYFTGPAGKSNFIQFTDETMVRDTIRYWADQGVKWFKVYRHTRPEDLKVIIDEAHKNGKGFDPQKMIAEVKGHVGSETDNSLKYLGQRPPGMVPEIFAPDFISKPTEYEFGSVFSRDAESFFYGVDVGGKAEIRFTQLMNGVWTIPEIIISHPVYGLNDPFLSPEEDQLFFISDLPKDGKKEKKNYDIWYANKEVDGWSKPINAGPNINTSGNEYYISFTNDGTMYFSSNIGAEENQGHNLDIYSAKRIDGAFAEPVRLSDAINTKAYEADVFVAPDESYLIFCAMRKEGLGRGDLYISFKQEDGGWTEAKNMGPIINSAGHELCPFVSSDGKYFFYTSRQDIYWVDAAVIENYR